MLKMAAILCRFLLKSVIIIKTNVSFLSDESNEKKKMKKNTAVILNWPFEEKAVVEQTTVSAYLKYVNMYNYLLVLKMPLKSYFLKIKLVYEPTQLHIIAFLWVCNI